MCTISFPVFPSKIDVLFVSGNGIIVWDNTSLSEKLEDNDLTIIFLPSYSPELNPTERFFQEMRKVNANRIFENIEEQEKLIDEVLTDWINNKEKIKKLCGFHWIIKDWNKCLNV